MLPRNWRLGSRLKKATLSFDRGVKIADTANVAMSARFETGAGGAIRVGERCHIMQCAMLLAYGGKIELGEDCSVNPFVVLYGHGGLSIGKGVRIAAHAVIIPANHVFAARDKPIAAQGLTKQGIAIEDDVWIGTGARILDGAHVAQGCVIAAGAVVTKATEPYGVYAGVPARRVAERG